ncbi:transcriptional activator, TenA family [Thermaerobacter marianensis DSM 12885]|uniref:Aminopyrimidine aminohydrolase n=1 Tax=Thermaerobacter marianensis (strain ATCC 700841 / DSM 12885 / JCM 10246 / 7p75a) TaxID=644966 RepID=E6SJ50_THEM7|nr:thiaminase II [Thermaerobacter marianensis]ADU52074.1 transcriptional activator, TenA family [Thermaerobacter marianensis DSM 12885]
MVTDAGGTAPFHQELEEHSRPVWDAIFELPFVREVGDGTLALERFAYFIAQDVLYLDQFARVLARGATLADTPATREMFLRHAANVGRVEERLHEDLAPRIGLDVEAVRRQEPAPVTVAYTDHLLRVAHTGTLGELVAAVLPCYWVYARVGERLARRLPDHDVYRQWILAYASPEFHRSVDEQLALVDRLATLAGADERRLMHQWFLRSLRYEWMFWDQAYRTLRWPVAP